MRNGKRGLSALVMMVFLACFTVGTAQAQIPGQIPNLDSWVGTWFKVTLTGTAYHFSNYGVKPSPATPTPVTIGKAYLNITSWNPSALPLGTLTADIYIKDHNTGTWIPTPFATMDIDYFAGSDLKFMGSAQLATPNDITMGIVFIFTGKKVGDNFVLGGVTKLSTTGSYMLEIDDALNSTERWAGSVKLSGPMVPATSLPFVPVPAP
jgi:hypothetical protein